jgi:hypothetical protein
MKMSAVLSLMAMALLTACGGGSSTSPSSKPYSQHIAGTVDVYGTTEHSLSIPRSGTMIITLTWSNGADLDLYLTNSSCTTSNLPTCTLFASATGTIPGRETVQRTVTNGETYKIFVDNNSLSLSSNYSIDLNIQ